MIFSQLTHIAHVQTLRRRLRLVAIHILLIAVFLLLLQAVDCIACLRESTTGQLTILATAVSALSMFFFLFLDFRHPRKAANVAKDIECSEPQFKDALNCTIELEQQPADKLNDVERLLVQRTNRVFDDNEKQILSSQRKRYRHSLPLLLTAILSIILLGEFSPVCQKAFCWLEEKITGVSTGIVIISPQENSFLIHSDIRVQVGVHRGPTAATIHYQTSGGDCETYPMHPIEDSPGESSIVLYDISGPTQYKITTDLLETPWMELTTYPIPTVKSVSMKTSPQAYTGLQPQSFNEFSDVTIVGGDSVQLEVAIENGSAIALKSEDELLSMTPKGNLYTLDFVPQKTTAWDVVITDMHQRLHTVGNFIITVTPDLPPVIEKQEPAEDAKLKPRDSLRFSVNATDDFGLTKFALVYRIIGKEQTSRDLLTKDSHGTRECNASFLWDISAMKLTPGDVIACMLIAVDNRLPKPNVTRSDAFYVSIIPDAEDITADGESSQKEQKIDISDLIAESKRLLRATWDIQSLESPSETMLEETTIALKDLRIEALRRMAELQESAHAPSVPEPFKTFFNTCADELANAVEELQKTNTESSITHQENALAALIRIESELMKNKMKSDKAKNDGQQDENSKNNEEEKEESSDDSQDQQANAQLLEKAIQTLREIIARQDSLIAAAQHNDTPTTALAETQQTIRNDTGTLQHSLNNLDEAEPARNSLQNAQNEMSGTIAAFRRNNVQTASIHAKRSLQHLVDAQEQLENALRQHDTNQAKQLAQQAKQLAGKQKEAAQKSENLQKLQQENSLSDEQRKEAKKQQDALRSQTETLKQRIEQFAGQLDNTLPETAKQMRNHADNISKEDIIGKQKKAANALLYKRFERAETEQSKAAESLEKLANDIDKTADSMPNYTPEQLRQMLQQLEKTAETTKQAMNDENAQRANQQLQRTQQRTEKLLDKLNQLLEDKRLSDAKHSLPEGFGDSDNAQKAQAMLDTINQAMNITAEYLRQFEKMHNLQLHREFVTPPDKYRRLVEEYFKGLGK